MGDKSAKKRTVEGRYIGWQATPIHQSRFGNSTHGGERVEKLEIKHSTGPQKTVSSSWFELDASKTPIGRMASVAATILMGKHKTSFTPGAGSGDFVVITNADKAFFTSDKADKKIFYWHTGWMGGIKMETAREALEKHPQLVIYDAVKGMMPRTRLSRYQLNHLKIERSAQHQFSAQQPQKLDLKDGEFKAFKVGA